MENKEVIKVLSFNCWGLHYKAEKLEYRLEAIRKTLAEGEYDVICLQEIWSELDFDKFVLELKGIYPYSYYFKGNHFIGSGCCVFSKFKIIETLFHRFSLNGHVHYVQHGDWFTSKGIGLVKVETNRGFLLNIYITHLVGHYAVNDSPDIYIPHRTSQGLELAQFIALTSPGCDAYFLFGDFNSHGDSVVYGLVTNYLGMKDCFFTQEKLPEPVDACIATHGRPDNEFTPKDALTGVPLGNRLDYIFYGNCSATRVTCRTCGLAMTKIPSTNENYSDHEGVSASLLLERSIVGGATYDSVNKEKALVVFDECRKTLDDGMKENNRCQLKGLAMLIGLIALVIGSILYGNGIFGSILLFILGIVFHALLWFVVVIKNAERKSFTSQLQDLAFIRRQCEDQLKTEQA